MNREKAKEYLVGLKTPLIKTQLYND